MTVLLPGRYSALLWSALLGGAVFGQGWVLESVIPVFSDTNATDHFVLDVDGGTMACGRSAFPGGEVKLFDRNAGGYGQWEEFHHFASDRVGFGFALDLSGRRLALGRKRGDDLAAEQGEVHVYDLHPDASVDQVVDRGSAMSVDDVARDGYGHSVLMMGDTLFVGAVGRSHPRGSGAVHVHAFPSGNDPAWPQVDLLQPASTGFDLPIMKDFGASMVLQEDHLVIASPGSGYSSLMHCGALHTFARGAGSGHWTERDHWYDAAITVRLDTNSGSNFASFDVNDLGRTGLLVQAGSVFAHWAGYYYTGNIFQAIEEPPLQPACDVCGLRSFGIGMNGELEPEAPWAELDTAIGRGYSAWTMNGELIAVNVFDDTAWKTLIYRRTSWAGFELVATIPSLADGIDYNGPVALVEGLFVRSARQDLGDNVRSFSVEVYALDDFTGLAGMQRPSGPLNVWPSPSSGSCNVTFNTSDSWVLTVVAANGPVERRVHCMPGATVSIVGLPRGLHLLRAVDARGSTNMFRLVVQ